MKFKQTSLNNVSSYSSYFVYLQLQVTVAVTTRFHALLEKNCVKLYKHLAFSHFVNLNS